MAFTFIASVKPKERWLIDEESDGEMDSANLHHQTDDVVDDYGKFTNTLKDR